MAMDKGEDAGGLRYGLVVQLKPGAVPQYKRYLDDSKGGTVQLLDRYPAANRKEALATLPKSPSHFSNGSLHPPTLAMSYLIRFADAARPFTPHTNWIAVGSGSTSHILQFLLSKNVSTMRFQQSLEVHGTPKDLEGAPALADR